MKAWELIADESRWTKDAWARDNRGAFTTPTDPLACRWCALGALVRVYPESRTRTSIAMLYHRTYGSDIVQDNDRGDMTAEKMSARLRVAEDGCQSTLKQQKGETT